MRFLVGFLAGLIWSNWIEYAYHRWAMHTGLACTRLLPCVTRCIILRPPIPSTSR